MNFYFFLTVAAVLHFSEAVKVSVFYEALCYDSTRFITLQLYPNYSNLKRYLQLEFIPYGKAIHNFQNDKWVFDCQHGANECKGNKYQSCALALSQDQDTQMAFVHCVMRERNPADVMKMEQCAKRFNLSWERISACVISGKGDELLATNGDKTNMLVPNLSFVPTIVYDGRFDDFLQERSLVDFATVVCSKIVGEKPSFCDGKKMPTKKSFFDYFK